MPIAKNLIQGPCCNIYKPVKNEYINAPKRIESNDGWGLRKKKHTHKVIYFYFL